MAGSGPTPRPSVVVTSELTLVAETVVAALAARGFEASTSPWPADEGIGHRRDFAPEAAPRSGREIGLLVSDLDSWSRLWTAWLLITRLPLSWVVVTAAPAGPTWGAALDAGASLVMPSSTRLAPVCRAIEGVSRGTVRTESAEQETLVGQWTGLLERREVISRQVGSLTPREHEVLSMLHAGERISRIADLLGVSPVTVRSQVKAVLRKLDVSSQLGAVAALDDLLALEPWG